MTEGPFVRSEQSLWESTCVGCGGKISKQSTRVTICWGGRYKCFYHPACWRVVALPHMIGIHGGYCGHEPLETTCPTCKGCTACAPGRPDACVCRGVYVG